MDPIKPRRRHACALRHINDALAGGWNPSWIPGILLLGDGEAACSQGTGFLGLEAKSNMRTFLVAITGLLLFGTAAAQAKVSITVDKDAQSMTVAVDGVERYRWPVSSGLPSYETPNGSFKTFRMEADHYSKEFDEAPMPHAIFFTKVGHAIHGTDSVNRLGSPASHGCVRLSRANAATLFALVEREGVLNTTVTLTGSSQVALARNPRGRANTAVARRDTAPQIAPQYNNAGDPIVLTPQPGQVGAQADDGYIYPADGSSNEAHYPAPRTRRLYGAQVYPREQYYYDRGYAPQYAPQGYYQPRPNYQPRGLFTYQD
jgi:L,D-transpeptidase catalytic domain